MYLSYKNKHPRDDNIIFIEEGHKYEISIDPNHKYTSVTTWVHQFVQPFEADSIIDKMMNGKNWNESNKYWGLTKDEIKSLWNKNGKSSSELGTNMHYNIECFMNDCPLIEEQQNELDYNHQDLLDCYDKNDDKSDEWKYFLDYVKYNPNLTPYRTEWLVYNEDIKISGSIDMVYKNDDNTLSIYDWKRCKSIEKKHNWNKFMKSPLNHFPDTNYWHYALQLNIYKMILESKYGQTIKELFLVQLHPNNNSFNLIPLPLLNNEIDILVKNRIDLYNNDNITIT
jgi:ATP-dependent exoDNAse (exonuclease V) beta subunit